MRPFYSGYGVIPQDNGEEGAEDNQEDHRRPLGSRKGGHLAIDAGPHEENHRQCRDGEGETGHLETSVLPGNRPDQDYIDRPTDGAHDDEEQAEKTCIALVRKDAAHPQDADPGKRHRHAGDELGGQARPCRQDGKQSDEHRLQTEDHAGPARWNMFEADMRQDLVTAIANEGGHENSHPIFAGNRLHTKDD